MSATAQQRRTPPEAHHIDRRAAQLADTGNAEETLWTTRQLAEFLSVSPAWVEIGRTRNYGPPHVKVHARMVRYRKSDVLKWLDERAALMEARHA